MFRAKLPEHRGKRRQGFDTGVPGHLVRCGGALFRRHVRRLVHPIVGVADLLRIGSGGKDLSNQRIRIQRNRSKPVDSVARRPVAHSFLEVEAPGLGHTGHIEPAAQTEPAEAIPRPTTNPRTLSLRKFPDLFVLSFVSWRFPFTNRGYQTNSLK